MEAIVDNASHRKTDPAQLHSLPNAPPSKSSKHSKLKIIEEKFPKPEIWARVRPPPKFVDNVLKVDDSGKKLGVKIDDPYRKKEVYVYPTDGILYNTSQDETFHLVAEDLIEKALNGTSALFLVLGSAQSGKQFTLFGTPGKYDHRGLIPRTVDKIWNRMEVVNHDKLYQLFISGVQISQNHIKDLVTMTPYNIDCIGANGPSHALLHEVYSRDEAGAILHRIFSGSKTEKNEKSSRKSHMFIYLDLCVIKVNEKAPVQRSRITFAKVASIPKREHLHKNFGRAPGPCIDFQGCSCDPAHLSYSIRSLSKFQSKDMKFPYEAIKCCRKLKNSQLDNATNATDIRRDLFFLEQLFVRANALRKLNALKMKKKKDLMKKYMSRLHITPSQFVRQSKLTHCLKDMCKVDTEIRVLIHIRPETAHIDTTIDALRFAERAKGITSDAEYMKNRGRQGRRQKRPGSASSLASESKKPEVDESIMSSILAEAEQNGDDVTIGLNPYQVRMIHQQLNQYFTEKLELKEVKEKPLKKLVKKVVAVKALIGGTSSASKPSKHSERPSTTLDNKIPTPPPSAADEIRFLKPVDLIPHPHQPSNEEEKNTESGGDPPVKIEKEKSADVIFKKEDDTKHANKKGKKQALQSRVEKSKKDKKKDSLNSSSDKKLPSSAKAGRKKSRLGLPTPPNTAPLAAKEKKKQQEKEETELQEVVEEDAPPTCKEVWNAFMQSRNGFRSFMEFKKTRDLFGKTTLEQQNLIKYSSDLRQKIIPLQAQVDESKAKRFLKFKKKPELMKSIAISRTERELRHEIKMMQLCRDPLLVRLKNMNRQVGEQQTGLEDTRMTCENAFQLFSLHHFGVIFPANEIPFNTPGFQFDSSNITAPPDQEVVSKTEDDRNKSKKTKRKRKSKTLTPASNAMRRKTKSFPEELVDSIHSKHYQNVSRVGKVQAAILRKLNHFKPAWIKYY